MGTENYVYIQKDGEAWKGYMESSANPRPLLNNRLFITASLEEAIAQAEAQDVGQDYMVANETFFQES